MRICAKHPDPPTSIERSTPDKRSRAQSESLGCRGTESSEQGGVRSTHAVQLCRNGANLPCSMLLQQAAHQTHEDAVDLGQPVSLQLERMPTSCSRTSTVKWLPAPVGGSGLSPALRHFQRSEKGTKTVQGQHGSTVCFYCTILPP